MINYEETTPNHECQLCGGTQEVGIIPFGGGPNDSQMDECPHCLCRDRQQLPECSDTVLEAATINRWFDYWVHKAKQGRSSRTPLMVECVEKIRACALSGVRKNRRNKRDVNRLTIMRLRKLTEQLEQETTA